jgi:hypothetical protein
MIPRMKHQKVIHPVSDATEDDGDDKKKMRILERIRLTRRRS